MPRKLRLQYPGAIYHAMNRGDRREDIFRDPGHEPSGCAWTGCWARQKGSTHGFIVFLLTASK